LHFENQSAAKLIWICLKNPCTCTLEDKSILKLALPNDKIKSTLHHTCILKSKSGTKTLGSKNPSTCTLQDKTRKTVVVTKLIGVRIQSTCTLQDKTPKTESVTKLISSN
jgi:hypothetical protein